MSRIGFWNVIAGMVIAGSLCGTARADVKLPKVIADHMVLQQKLPIPIWGTADPGEVVTVSIGDNTATATTNEKGKWSLKLKEMTAGGPHEVVVKGKNEIKQIGRAHV